MKIIGTKHNIQIGADESAPDWRKNSELLDEDPCDDSDEDGPTPPDVVAMLGFDPDKETAAPPSPRESAVATVPLAEFNVNHDPDSGQFASGGGGKGGYESAKAAASTAGDEAIVANTKEARLAAFHAHQRAAELAPTPEEAQVHRNMAAMHFQNAGVAPTSTHQAAGDHGIQFKAGAKK